MSVVTGAQCLNGLELPLNALQNDPASGVFGMHEHSAHGTFNVHSPEHIVINKPDTYNNNTYKCNMLYEMLIKLDDDCLSNNAINS